MYSTIADNKMCTGCNACGLVCPNKAITVERNEKGFFHAAVNYSKCVKCGLCLKACHLLNIQENKSSLLSVFAVKNKSDAIRKISSSGGIYMAVAKHIIEKNGIVYGAAFEKDNMVRHVRAKTIQEAQNCCQSKYVQSALYDTYEKVRIDLISNKSVLFTGTPCQASGLLQYLKMKKTCTDKLVLLDFVCHGTPSPKVFNSFISFLETKYKKKIKKFYFRDKSQGWRGNSYKIDFIDGTKNINGFYTRGFNKLYGVTTNDACFECHYSHPERFSDITIGDFWGIEKTSIASFEDSLGVSLLIVHTQKGVSILKSLENDLIMIPVSLNDSEKNTPLFKAPIKPKKYDEFWKDFFDGVNVFDKYCKFNGKKGIEERIKWIIMYRFSLKNIILKARSLYFEK